MAASTAISIEQYLGAAYRPDCDYVDGELVQRNVGEYQHGQLQSILAGIFRDLSRTVPIRVVTELRIRVSPTRFRIPDLCITLKKQPAEQVPMVPPFLCIEILSPEDRMSRVIERVKEFLAFGVEYVWVIDPQNRVAYAYRENGVQEIRDVLATADPDLRISLHDLFAEFDEAEKIAD